MLYLEEISEVNYNFYKTFDEIFESNLSEYQSRIYPNSSAELLKWYYIKYDDFYIGSVWIEKEEKTFNPVLGVFIAYEEYRNKGYGTTVIKMIINDMDKIGINEIYLRVREKNKRAICCYNRIGFKEINRVEKNGVIGLEMMYRK